MALHPFRTSLVALAIFAWPAAAQEKEKTVKKAGEDGDEAMPIAAPSMVGNIPIWQLKPFDRLELKNDEHTKIDVEPDRLPKDADFKDVEANKWCGKMGLPWPGTQFRRDLWYRFTSSSEGRKYEVIGKGIAKIEHYEDIVFGALMGELNKENDIQKGVGAVKLDDCLEMLRILQERQPNEPRNIFARIRYHAVEAKVAEFKHDQERAFISLLEEKKLYALVPATVKVPTWIRALDPIDRRIADLCDRWTGFCLSLRKYADGRRVIARLEKIFPDHDVAKKWRKNYADLVRPLVEHANQQIANNFYTEALITLDSAAEIQPDHPGMRATMEKAYAKHPRLRVAVGELPGYHSGPAGWSPADVRAADLLHEPLMRVKSAKEGVTEFDSRLVNKVDVSDLNRKAVVQIRSGLSWPDGKPVTPVDVQRVFADARHRAGAFYHPALEFLLTNVQSQAPDLVTLEFDRPQFQAKAWFQMPFLRMGEAAEGGGVGWTGMGPFYAQERRPDRILYLANSRYLDPGKPIIKQVVETRLATPEERFRAIQNGEVEMVGFVPFRNLPYVQNIPSVKPVKLTTPKVSVLQLNFDRDALRSPTLRRAIVYAIDRAEILRKIGASDDKDVKLLTGALPYGAFGYNTETKLWPYEPYLAKTLVAAVTKELKTIPPLTFAHQGNESTRMACEEIAKQLRSIGLQVTLTEIDERAPDPREADLRYQMLSVSDPIFDLVTTLTRDNPSLVRNAGPRLRQYLIDLLKVPNVTEAARLLPEIHQALHDDVALIPLWQWNETCLVSDAIIGAPGALSRPYENIASWKTVPRYPPALWETKPLASSRRMNLDDLLADRRKVHP